jgi:hypothetical protein
MYLAYVDESGDRGVNGSRTYTLACVLVRSGHWKSTFDGLLSFRRFLKGQVGLPVRAELKANHLLRNGGAFRALALGERARRFIYRGALQLQPKLGLLTFAIVIDKAKLNPELDPFEYAWTYLLQRLETLTRKSHDEVLVIHDEGEPDRIRKIARRARRFGSSGSLFGGSRKLPFEGLIDDPVSRQSHQALFLQLADLNAYAAYRRAFPPPQRQVQIVPELMWDELGSARYRPANMRAGGPSDGIVLWPK